MVTGVIRVFEDFSSSAANFGAANFGAVYSNRSISINNSGNTLIIKIHKVLEMLEKFQNGNFHIWNVKVELYVRYNKKFNIIIIYNIH